MRRTSSASARRLIISTARPVGSPVTVGPQCSSSRRTPRWVRSANSRPVQRSRLLRYARRSGNRSPCRHAEWHGSPAPTRPAAHRPLSARAPPARTGPEMSAPACGRSVLPPRGTARGMTLRLSHMLPAGTKPVDRRRRFRGWSVVELPMDLSCWCQSPAEGQRSPRGGPADRRPVLRQSVLRQRGPAARTYVTAFTKPVGIPMACEGIRGSEKGVPDRPHRCAGQEL